MAKASTSSGGGASRGHRSRRDRKAGARPSAGLTAERRLELYRWMILTRALEERLVNLYRQNRVVGGLYRSLGQEAETVGAAAALETQDIIGPLIRNMGAVLVKGYRPRDVAMQYMARAGGPTRGKDLNTHFGTAPEPGVVAPVSMLGDLVPVMAGVALAAKLRREDRVALTWIGDGGTSTGAFYEGMNLAAVWKLPLIVVAEDNRYAYSTPVARQMAVDTIADKAAGLGIFGETLDGNDVLAVYDAVRAARARAVAGEGPSLLEVKTYRMKGHAEHDVQAYVPDGEIAAWAAKDPVRRYETALAEGGHAAPADLERVRAEVAALLDEEIAAAEASPLPDPAVALENVYASPVHAEDVLAPYRASGGGPA
jgi:TPP-dependent pyruvate/acetoin dehydrogenase alpha subunit